MRCGCAASAWNGPNNIAKYSQGNIKYNYSHIIGQRRSNLSTLEPLQPEDMPGSLTAGSVTKLVAAGGLEDRAGGAATREYVVES